MFADWDGSLSDISPMKQVGERINKLILLVYICCTTRHCLTQSKSYCLVVVIKDYLRGSIWSLNITHKKIQLSSSLNLSQRENLTVKLIQI